MHVHHVHHIDVHEDWRGVEMKPDSTHFLLNISYTGEKLSHAFLRILQRLGFRTDMGLTTNANLMMSLTLVLKEVGSRQHRRGSEGAT